MRLNKIKMCTPDTEKLKAFYESFELTFRREQLPQYNEFVYSYYTADLGGDTLFIYPDKVPDFEKKREITSSSASIFLQTIFGFEVDDLDEMLRKMPESVKSRICAPKLSPLFGYAALVEDPESRVFYLYQKDKDKISD